MQCLKDILDNQAVYDCCIKRPYVPYGDVICVLHGLPIYRHKTNDSYSWDTLVVLR